MNKRGEHSDFVVYMFIALFVIAFMIIGYAVITSKTKYLTTYTSKDLHTNILLQRILYSPTCFAYVDYEIGRTYPGIMDWRKFSDDSLNGCMQSSKFAFKMVLQNLDIPQTKIILSKNWKNNPSRTVLRSVLIKDDRLYRGKLTIDVQNE